MGAAAKLHGGGFGELVAKNFSAARADESVMGTGVDDEDEVWEAIDEAAGEFLFFV